MKTEYLEQIERQITALEGRHVFNPAWDLREHSELLSILSDDITQLQIQHRELLSMVGLIHRLIQAKWPLEEKQS